MDGISPPYGGSARIWIYHVQADGAWTRCMTQVRCFFLCEDEEGFGRGLGDVRVSISICFLRKMFSNLI